MNIENHIISKVLYTGNILELTDRGITEDLFFDAQYKEAFKFIREFFVKYSAIPSVDLFEEQFPNIKLEFAKEPIGYYIDKLIEQYIRNKASQSILKYSDLIITNPLKGMELLKSDLIQLELDTNSTQDMSLSKNIEERKKHYEELGNGIDGYFTPWETLDYATRGIHPNEYWAIIGRPASGKSWILTLFANALREQGLDILIATEEMSIMQFEKRLDAVAFKLPYEQFRQGLLNEGDKKRYFKGLDELAKAKNQVYITTANSVSAISAKAKQYGAKAVLIDGAYLLHDDQRGSSMWERITNISRDLKRMANKLGIPVISAWQFNRGAEGRNEPTLSDVGLSDAIGQDADVALGVIATKDMRLNKERKIVMLKQREGDLVNFKISFDLDTMNFKDFGAEGVDINDKESFDEELDF